MEYDILLTVRYPLIIAEIIIHRSGKFPQNSQHGIWGHEEDYHREELPLRLPEAFSVAAHRCPKVPQQDRPRPRAGPISKNTAPIGSSARTIRANRRHRRVGPPAHTPSSKRLRVGDDSPANESSSTETLNNVHRADRLSGHEKLRGVIDPVTLPNGSNMNPPSAPAPTCHHQKAGEIHYEKARASLSELSSAQVSKNWQPKLKHTCVTCGVDIGFKRPYPSHGQCSLCRHGP